MSFLRKIFGGSQVQPELPFAVPDGFKFAYLDWHMSGVLTIKFLNAPTPDNNDSSVPQQDESRASDEKAAQRLIDGLKSSGWYQFSGSRNQEGWSVQLLRRNLEPGYEYAVLSTVKTINPPQSSEQLLVEGIYSIGRQNQNLGMAGKTVLIKYNEALNYLDKQGWTFVNEEDYPYHGQRSNRRTYLRWYRRAAK
ncbi:MAG TPA: hypothetical protein VHL11_04330 [Phototrophicaceae bacterium]|nr:hypothetical protein [Phototrophicaceae bacterium]